MTGVIVMVDLYATTMRLAQGYLDRGYCVVQLRSAAQIPALYRGFDTSSLAGSLVHGGDLDETVAAVARLEPVAVTVGGESGVELADAIADRLGLAGNGTGLSSVRRDKFAMIETLRAAGVAATEQLLVTGPGELHRWHEARGGPVVVKPTRSAGNDGVHFCATPDASVAAYERVRYQTNIFGIRNEGVVAQEMLVGGEYVVNTVSCAGEHRVTDMWKYVKLSANGVTDRVAAAVSVSPGDPRAADLCAYARAVLDALGIRFGPAHLEIMMTADGPRLVEIGARLCGADTARYARHAGGESQIEWTVAAFTDPERFARDNRRPQVPHAHVAMVFLTSPYDGVLRGYPRLGEVTALPSYLDHHEIVGVGDRLQRTVSDTTEPMMIGLANANPDILERDLTTVIHLDGPGFYAVDGVSGDGTDAGPAARESAR